MAIRIPDGPSVETAQLRTVGPSLIDVPDVGGAVAQAGQQVGRAVADVGATMQKVEREADALRITQSLTEFERRTTNTLQGETLGPIDAAFEGTPRKAGYLETKGLTAGEASQETLEELQKSLDEIGAKLLPRQQEAFYARANALREDARRRVEGHVASEFQRAKVEGLKAAKAEVLRSIANQPRSGAGWLEQERMAEESIAGLASSPEVAAAEVAAFRGDAAITRISSLISDGDIDGAEAVFAAKKEWIGTRSDEVAAVIKRARAGDDIKKADESAAVQVQGWVRESTPAGKYADRAAVMAKLQAVSADDPSFKKLQEHTLHQLAIDAERKEADIATHRNFADQAVSKGTSIPPASEAFLYEFDAKYLRGLKEHRDELFLRRAARAEGTSAQRSAIDKKQRDNDEEFRARFNALPYEEQAKKTPEQFAAEYAADRPGFAVSPVALAKAAEHRTGTIERLKSGDISQEVRFRTKLEKDLPGVLLEPKGSKKGQPRPEVKAALEAQGKADRDPVAESVGHALEEYRKRREEKGKDLTSLEEEQLLGEMKANSFEITTKGLIFESKKRVPGALRPVTPVQTPAAASPEKQPETPAIPTPVRPTMTNKKTGQKRYVNPDGSLGEVVK